MIEAKLDIDGVTLWTPVRIADYNASTGIYDVARDMERFPYLVRRGDLRDDQGGREILGAVAGLTCE